MCDGRVREELDLFGGRIEPIDVGLHELSGKAIRTRTDELVEGSLVPVGSVLEFHPAVLGRCVRALRGPSDELGACKYLGARCDRLEQSTERYRPSVAVDLLAYGEDGRTGVHAGEPIEE